MRLHAGRHGETTENREKRILGRSPGHLTEDGIAKAAVLAQSTVGLGIDFVLASPLQRSVDTCEPMPKAKPGLLVAYTPLLEERKFGSWEGELRKSVDWQGLWESPDEPELSARIGAEPLDQFTRRIARVVLNVHELFGDTDKNVLLMAHIGVLNRLNYLTDPAAFEYIEYPNAEAVEFDVDALVRNSRELLGS